MVWCDVIFMLNLKHTHTHTHTLAVLSGFSDFTLLGHIIAFNWA